jgi:serine/threonine protein phosphatase PrpC
MIQIIEASLIGPGHLQDRTPNQDAVASNQRNGFWAVAVADGLGSRKRADIGSKLATNLAVSICLTQPFDVLERELISTIYTEWLNALKAKNILPDEAATTLLFVWGDSTGRFRYFQLGDGLISSSKYVYSYPNFKDFSNQTTALGISKKFSDWLVGTNKLTNSLESLYLMTDGISEDISDHIGFCSLLHSSAKGKSTRAIKKKLIKLFKAWRTPFHTDDKTLAMVIFNDK